MQLEALNNISDTSKDLGVGVILDSLKVVIIIALEKDKGAESLTGLISILIESKKLSLLKTKQ